MATTLSPIQLFPHRQTLTLLPFRNRSEGLTLLPSSHLLVSHTIWVWARKGTEASTSFDRTLMCETWATTDDVLRRCSVRKPSHTARACIGGPGSSPFGPRARDRVMQSLSITLLPLSLSIFPAEASDKLFPLCPFPGPAQRILSIVSLDDCCFMPQFVMVCYTVK